MCSWALPFEVVVEPVVATRKTALTALVSLTMTEFDDLDPACRDSDGWFRIVGIGSLLAKSSAERSFPRLRDFRVVRLPMAVRVFGHAAPVFFERGIASPEQPCEFSSLCAEPGKCDERAHPRMRPPSKPSLGAKDEFSLSGPSAVQALDEGRFMYVTSFYIPPKEMVEYRRRELEFTYVAVSVYGRDHNVVDGIPAVLCGRGSDDLVKERQNHSATEWHSSVTKFGIDSLWNYSKGQILPCRPYLRLCVLASEMLGEDVKNNYLDTTFLVDRKTTIREHLAQNPDILTTPPPENVRKFYTP